MGTVFHGWEFDRYIGGGAFGKVYRIVREDFGHTYEAALKVIEIPQNPTEVVSLRNEGMTDENVTEYFYGMVEEIVEEFILMSKLKGNSNIVSYEDHAVVKKKDGLGWTIYIRMELLTPLFEYVKKNRLTIKDVIQLGIDMCHALEICQKFNIIHRDIKPENIFVSETGDYKLGDFGIARELEKTSSGLSKKGTKSYMAPEVFKGMAYNSNVDVYSLGIVLYRFLNNNRLPFISPAPQPIRYADKERAEALRMSGQPFPKPVQANGRLAEIILKACSYMPNERYESAHAMRLALEEVWYSDIERRMIYPEGDTLNNDKAEYVLDSTHSEKRYQLPEIDEEQKDSTVYLSKEERGDTDSVKEEKKQQDENISADTQLKKEKALLHNKKISWIIIGVCACVFIIVLYFLDSQNRNEQKRPLQTIKAENTVDKKMEKAKELSETEAPKVKAIIVPDFTGLTKDAAEQLAVAHQVSVKTEKKEYSDTVKKGAIIRQNPKGDTKAEMGTVVSLTYSRGVEKIAVPVLSGLSAKDARKLLNKSKLKYKINKEYSSYIPNGYVASQSIKSGSKVEKGTVILITVSRGEKPAQRMHVPDNTYQATQQPVVTRRPTATRKPAATRKPVTTKKPVQDDFDLSEW